MFTPWKTTLETPRRTFLKECIKLNLRGLRVHTQGVVRTSGNTMQNTMNKPE